MYLESEIILRGMKFEVDFMAVMMAISSPTWFNWFPSGFFIAMFLWSFSLNQVPLPLLAFSLPLLMQAPSI